MTTAEGIARIIPHRYPILLVDRVLDVEVGRQLTAIKAVTCNEPWYGEDRCLPAPLLIESWAQAAVLLAVWEQPNPDVVAGKVELAGSIKNAVLGDPVVPGDVLEHRAEVVKAIGDTAVLAGESRVGTSTVLTVGSFVLALRDLRDLARRPAAHAGRGADRWA
ncbi:3-hydroxyacyl-ACP dehydratase FabZ family protein [Actinosynnema sp. NPDC050436]|uniref:3-hydroxyacyl-ACP dehydratase FabZ family protein n=1 Tax=Actinosynnema sp. NPDC050436 TaxID=3155659 RepID=UPI0033D97475